MYYNISFNTWLNYARKMQKRERFAQKQEVKRQRCWSEGIEFVPGVLNEPKDPVKYVQIEVEEVIYVTTEGEGSSSEEEIIPAKPRTYTLAELKKMRTCKPTGGIYQKKSAETVKISAPVFSTDKQGYSILKLLEKKGKDR